jgi:hypothetical protein
MDKRVPLTKTSLDGKVSKKDNDHNDDYHSSNNNDDACGVYGYDACDDACDACDDDD